MSDREMPDRLETALAMDAASIKFGFGVTAELGFEMKRLGVSYGSNRSIFVGNHSSYHVFTVIRGRGSRMYLNTPTSV